MAFSIRDRIGLLKPIETESLYIIRNTEKRILLSVTGKGSFQYSGIRG